MEEQSHSSEAKGKMPIESTGLMLGKRLDSGRYWAAPLLCTFSGHRMGLRVSTWRLCRLWSIVTAFSCGKAWPLEQNHPLISAIQLLPVKAPGMNFSFPEMDKLCPSGAESSSECGAQKQTEEAASL